MPTTARTARLKHGRRAGGPSAAGTRAAARQLATTRQPTSETAGRHERGAARRRAARRRVGGPRRRQRCSDTRQDAPDAAARKATGRRGDAATPASPRDHQPRLLRKGGRTPCPRRRESRVSRNRRQLSPKRTSKAKLRLRDILENHRGGRHSLKAFTEREPAQLLLVVSDTNLQRLPHLLSDTVALERRYKVFDAAPPSEARGGAKRVAAEYFL